MTKRYEDAIGGYENQMANIWKPVPLHKQSEIQIETVIYHLTHKRLNKLYKMLLIKNYRIKLNKGKKFYSVSPRKWIELGEALTPVTYFENVNDRHIIQ